MDEILLPPQIENKIKLWALRAIEKFGMPDSFFKSSMASCKRVNLWQKQKSGLKISMPNLKNQK